MVWFHRGAHCDGSWHRRFKTEKAALADLAKSLGRDHDDGEPLAADRRYVDDYGGTHRVEEGPAVSARTMDAIEAAFNARETGTATKRQMALLERHYM